MDQILGNKGRKPKHALSFPDIKRVVSFIICYSEEYGFPLPAAPSMEMHLSKIQSFCQHPQLKLISILDINLFVMRAMKGITLKNILKLSFGVCVPINTRTTYEFKCFTIKGMWNFQRSRTMAPMCSSNKIASLRTDVCPKCESLRWYVIGAVSEEAKLTALDDYKSHVEISQDIFISKSTLVSLHLHLCPSHLLSEHIYKCIVEYKCIKINVG